MRSFLWLFSPLVVAVYHDYDGKVSMTEDEKRQQKAMLLLECQEAQDNLAHLREKTRRMADGIGEIQKWVSDTLRMQSGHDQERARRDGNIRANLGAYRTLMNFDETLSLMDEFIAAEKLLEELRRRKADLGLK
jgi:hypothetical protein